MRFFTLNEANEMLPVVRKNLLVLQKLYSSLAEFREPARAAAASSEFGGGMRGGSGYVMALFEIGKITNEINEMGVQLKDYTSGLVDFPSIRDGRTVLLCWQLGESDTIEWWHEVETGFAGRQPI